MKRTYGGRDVFCARGTPNNPQSLLRLNIGTDNVFEMTWGSLAFFAYIGVYSSEVQKRAPRDPL